MMRISGSISGGGKFKVMENLRGGELRQNKLNRTGKSVEQ
jgi:hypothetical protein